MSMTEIQNAIPKADFSTIFRNIETMVKNGEIKKIFINHKETRYELADHAHNHFICNDCGDIESLHITLSKTELRAKNVSDITVRGTCNNCTN